jgi:hypothetical protein
MLSYYRYMVSSGRMTIDQVPEPYRSQLIAEQTTGA